MTATWSADELTRFDGNDELEIATERADGTRRRWTPIWVVTAGGSVYVRTWHRRDTGWFGDAIASQRARIRLPGLTVNVTVEDMGTAVAEHVDAAYRAKYGRYGSSVAQMVTDDAAASTLRLVRDVGIDHE